MSALARSIEQRVHLPESFEGFIIYCAGLILVVLGMTLHISLSAEILQAEVQVDRLRLQHERIGQENSELVWQIARESSLERLQNRVAGLGYAPIKDREYVPVVAENAAAGAPLAGGATTVAASAGAASPKPNLLEQLRAYFGGAQRDSALPSSRPHEPPASVRFVEPESADSTGPTTSATAEWWRKVWSDTLERGEKSLEWITGGQ